MSHCDIVCSGARRRDRRRPFAAQRSAPHVPEQEMVGARSDRLQHVPGLPVHMVRGAHAQSAREFQRGEIHRLQHVHYLCHLARIHTAFLWQRLQNYHTLPEHKLQRHCYSNLPVYTESIYHYIRAGEEPAKRFCHC